MAERRYPLSGEIDVVTAPMLESKLLVLANGTSDDLVLDCTDLEFIDSQGIAVLVRIEGLLATQGRRFRMENLGGVPRRSIEIVGLAEQLGIVEREPA